MKSKTVKRKASKRKPRLPRGHEVITSRRPRCRAKTKRGARCSRLARIRVKGKAFCTQHSRSAS